MQQQVVRFRVRDSLRARHFTCQLYRFVSIVDIHAICCQHFHRHKRAAKTLRARACVCVCVCVCVCLCMCSIGVVWCVDKEYGFLSFAVCKQLAVVWCIEWGAGRQLPLPTAAPPSLFLHKSPSYDETIDRGFGVKWRAGLTRERARLTAMHACVCVSSSHTSQPCACVSACLSDNSDVR